MRALALVVVTAALSGCATRPLRDQADLRLPTAVPRTNTAEAVALAPVVDARQKVLTHAREPQSSQLVGIVTPVRVFGWGRNDGARIAGDENITMSVAGEPATGLVRQTLDAWLGNLVAAVTSTKVASARSVTEGTTATAALDHRGSERFIVVPVLDQLDVVQLASEDSLAGSGSAQGGNQQVTTAGAASSSPRTTPYANVRLRLVLFESYGGRPTRRATAWIAESGTSLDAVKQKVSVRVADDLAAFMNAATGPRPATL